MPDPTLFETGEYPLIIGGNGWPALAVRVTADGEAYRSNGLHAWRMADGAWRGACISGFESQGRVSIRPEVAAQLEAEYQRVRTASVAEDSAVPVASENNGVRL
jgi:hypothetical protein